MGKQARTLIEALERLADSQQTGPSYVLEDGTLQFESFHELYRRANRIGRALQAHGLRKGDCLGLILPDLQQFIDGFFGALVVGVIPVPIYPPPPRFGRLDAYLRHVMPIVAKACPRMLLTDKHVQELFDDLSAASALPSLSTLDTLVHDIDVDHIRMPVEIRPEDTAFLQFTSGSTSRPKGVRLSHANLIANVHAIAHYGLQSTPEDATVSWLPLYHDMGLIGKVFVPMYAGMRGMLFIPSGLFLRRPLVWLHYISEQQATITFAPNFAYSLCLKRIGETVPEGLNLSSLRIAGCGAEPIRYDVLAAFARKFLPCGFHLEALLPCYGLAESTLAVTFSPVHTGMITDRILAEPLARGKAIPMDKPETAPEILEATAAQPRYIHLVSCGRVFPEHTCKIVDADGNTLPERRVGEILARGPSVMQGYFEDTEATAAAIQDGWLHTGDLGYLADNNLYVCGRSKDLLIIHGRNYYPQDLEWEASQVEGVREGNVVAFGVEDAESDREHIVIAAETKLPRERHAQLEYAVRARIHEGLALVVDHVLLLPPRSLPKTSSGKPQRARTRELFQSSTLGRPTESAAG